jgi:hypothetical protein
MYIRWGSVFVQCCNYQMCSDEIGPSKEPKQSPIGSIKAKVQAFLKLKVDYLITPCKNISEHKLNLG